MTDARRDKASRLRARLVEHAKACHEALDRCEVRPSLPEDLRDLRGADLRGASLRGADLRGANLWGANLRGANLCWANLRGANLCWADLRGANLCDADLWGADLWGANIRDANLSGANLRRADLRGAVGVTRIEAARYPCWRIGPYLAYGCECWPLAEWPLDKIKARRPNDVEMHAEVRSIVERLRAEAENSNTKEASNA